MTDLQKREILRPLMNVPHTLSLKFATPREVEGRYGNQMMFTVMHEGAEKLIFLDPVTARRITEQGLAAGEEFVLTRQELTQGRKKGIQWVIEREAAETPRRQGGSPAAAEATSPRHTAQAGGTSNESQRSTNKAAVTASGPERRPQVIPMPAPEPAPETESPSPVRQAGQTMGACLIAAIDALTIAQAYGLQHGLKLQWNEEDVRATGASLFIQHHRDAGFAARPQQPAAAGGAR